MRRAVLMLLVCLAHAAFAGGAAEKFSRASELFSRGEYGEAAYLLRQLSEDGQWSHGAQHNLGNVEWKVARPGPAILAWERARSLNPFDRNTAANLRFARTEANLVEPSRTWFEQYSEWLPAPAWLWTCAAGLWGGIIFLALPRLFSVRRADWHQAVAALLLTAFLLTLPAVWGIHTRGKMGVVLGGETPLRLTPTDDGEPLAMLQGGEIARIERVRDAFLYIRAEGDRAGWVKRDEFASIQP